MPKFRELSNCLFQKLDETPHTGYESGIAAISGIFYSLQFSSLGFFYFIPLLARNDSHVFLTGDFRTTGGDLGSSVLLWLDWVYLKV